MFNIKRNFGTFVSTNKQNIISAITPYANKDSIYDPERFPKEFNLEAEFFGCFDPFWPLYEDYCRKGLVMYLGFPVLNIDVLRLIDEFNEKFKNIQITVHFKESLFEIFVDEINSLCGVPITEKETNNIKTVSIVFTVDFKSDEYTILAKKKLTYVIHHMIRSFSYQESFLDLYQREYTTAFDHLVVLTNNSVRYSRGLCNESINKEYFDGFDNIYLANEIGNLSVCAKQTAIMRAFYNGNNAIKNNPSLVDNFKNQLAIFAPNKEIIPGKLYEVVVVNNANPLNPYVYCYETHKIVYYAINDVEGKIIKYEKYVISLAPRVIGNLIPLSELSFDEKQLLPMIPKYGQFKIGEKTIEEICEKYKRVIDKEVYAIQFTNPYGEIAYITKENSEVIRWASHRWFLRSGYTSVNDYHGATKKTVNNWMKKIKEVYGTDFIDLHKIKIISISIKRVEYK